MNKLWLMKLWSGSRTWNTSTFSFNLISFHGLYDNQARAPLLWNHRLSSYIKVPPAGHFCASHNALLEVCSESTEMVVLQEVTCVAVVIPGQFSLILKTGKRHRCILWRSATNASILFSCWYASSDSGESHMHWSPRAGRASVDLSSLCAAIIVNP